MKLIMQNIHTMLRTMQLRAFKGIVEYVTQNLVIFEFLVVLAYLLHFYIYIPYVNLLISPWMIYFTILILAKILLRITDRSIFAIIICLFFASFLFTLTGKAILAEEIGDVLYGLLWFLSASTLLQLIKL